MITEAAIKQDKMANIVRKLLNQSQCPGATSEEAMAHYGKAQELITKYNISQAMIDIEEKQDTPADIVKRTIYKRGKGKMPTWILDLARGVAKANNINHWFSSSRWHGEIGAAGTELNLTAAELIIPFLIGQVDKLYKEEKPSWLNRSEGKRWANAFRLGCASKIAQRLREAKKAAETAMRAEAATTPADRYTAALKLGDNEALLKLDAEGVNAKPAKYAMAIVETALARLQDDKKRADDYVKENMKFGRGNARNHYGSNGAAFSSGRDAGNRAILAGPKGRIG